MGDLIYRDASFREAGAEIQISCKILDIGQPKWPTVSYTFDSEFSVKYF